MKNNSPTSPVTTQRKKIRIGTPTGENYGTELNWREHGIKEIEVNPNNEYVPYSIDTCCGKYIPTSAADGHWEDSMHLGGWEYINE